ncbi:putative mitochondrial distribution and morphology protein [Tuber indicum]|nr:putative mitochondrial distribution and morphology protein [Tuber indicum]
MALASGHRLCAAFWDTLLPLISNPKLPSGSSTFTTGLSQKRFPISTHRPRLFTSLSSTTSTRWYPRSKYVVSRGFAGFCVWTNVTPAAASETTSCAVSTADRGILSSGVLDRRKIIRIAGSSWARSLHIGQKAPKPKVPAKRNSSWAPKGKVNSGKAGSGDRGSGRRNRRIGNGRTAEEMGEKSNTNNNAPDNTVNRHRLSKDEMLAAATGFLQRLSIRTKWLAIRQMRPYNLDDIGAFFSWLFLGHVLWVVLGTTTFVSLTIFLCNTVFAQETLAGAVGNYLTRETGVKIVFESAIVPRWKDGCISFKNVFVARRPGHGKHGDKNVQKGSSVTAAAAAAAAVHADDANSKDAQHRRQEEVEEEDTNYTQFDVTIDTVNVTLSFAKWMNGKGLLKDVEIKGVRGVIDRTHVVWDDVDPRAFKYEHQPGDFEIDSFKLEDLLVTVHQPDDFRPFSVSIFSCDLPQLRKQWLFYDFLSANMMSGSFDDSLFTIHPRQTHMIGAESLNGNNGNENSSQAWKKTSRLRIDGLGIDHLNRGVEGPFSWIQHGNVDIVADIMFPTDDDLQFTKVVQHIVERMEATVSPPSSSSSNRRDPSSSDQKFVIMDLRIQLNDVRAAVPLFSKDLSYVNSALIRPIVAYINSRRTYIPINCRVTKRANEFDGSWTMYDSGLVEEVSAETYAAFARDAIDHQARGRRFKKVGLWSLQLAAQALLMAMAGNIA